MTVTPDRLIKQFIQEKVPINCKPISSLKNLGYSESEIDKLFNEENELAVSYKGESYIIRRLDDGYVGIRRKRIVTNSELMRAVRRRW